MSIYYYNILVSIKPYGCIIMYVHNVHVHICSIYHLSIPSCIYSGVRLSYQWCYYHPRTELSHDTISPLVPCTSCPFVLEDSSSSMELLPGEAKLIPLVYKPSKVQ